MDVDKCVELHNKILEHGWLRSGKTIEDFEQSRQAWFDYHGDQAEAISDLLSPDLIAFLERAYEIDCEDGHSFFYFVGGLAGPVNIQEQMEVLNSVCEEEGETRYVLLYIMNHSFGSHPVGLIYDQEEDTAIMCVDLDDTETVQNGRTPWFPLETVLEAWLDMIEQGKVVATPEADDVEKPWVLSPYSPKILQDTVDLFNALVREIESRLPGGSTGTGGDSSPFIEEAILDTSNPQRGFAYHFAQKAKRPQFRYIAPGLEIPSSSEDTAQPFASLRSNAEDIEILPLLLFRAVDNDAPCMAPASGDECPFSYPFNGVEKYPAGLYLSCTSSSYKNSFEDESILVLPFRIGARGYARKSDGARFGENTRDVDDDVESSDTFSDVYQPGHQPFTEMHQVRLFCVLENWLGMVQRGDWKVDANGVMGGIDEWKKADTEESWGKYVIPPTW